MKIIFTLLLLCIGPATLVAQKISNPFFALHNIIRGDSVYNTADKQVPLIKNAGYDGIEINSMDGFDDMKTALDKYGFAASYFYVRITLDSAHFDNRLQSCISRLKGSQTIIAPYVVASTQYPAGSQQADTLVLRLLQQVADWAAGAGLQTAIYPHFGFYIQRTGHALEFVKKINRKNFGMSFNLCHWLATTPAAERPQLHTQLQEMKPYLKMITICGANDVVTTQAVPWDDYILPLGSGSFDTYGLLKYCVRTLKLSVPIGVQCYNIKTGKPALVQHTIEVWEQYKQQLETEK